MNMKQQYYTRLKDGAIKILPDKKTARQWLRLAAYKASGAFTSPITEWGPVLEVQGRLPGTTTDRFQFLARWIPGMVVHGEPLNRLSWREVEKLIGEGVWHPTPSGLVRADGFRLVYDID